MSLDTYLSVCYNNIAHFGCCCGISWRVSSASVSPPCKNQGNLNWLCKSWHNHFQLSIFNFQFNKQVWRNWQTRMVQVHVKAISCRFKSCFPHQMRTSVRTEVLILLQRNIQSCFQHQTSIIRTRFSKSEMGTDFFLSFCRKGITH